MNDFTATEVPATEGSETVPASVTVAKLNVAIATVDGGNVRTEIFSMGGAPELVARTARAQLGKVADSDTIAVTIETTDEAGNVRAPLDASGDTELLIKALKGALGIYAPRRARAKRDASETADASTETATPKRGKRNA